MKECASVFDSSLQKLRSQLEKQIGDDAMLVWDKVGKTTGGN